MSDTLSWKTIFTERMAAAGFTPEDSQAAYTIEMEARTFFDFHGIVPESLALQNIEQDEKTYRYHWESRSLNAVCPFCNSESFESNDYYTKPLQDIPFHDKAVFHVIRFKKYHCGNEKCSCDEFVERFTDFSGEDARKTNRFKKHCIERALGCACNHAEYELRKEGAVISNDTIARYLKAEAAKEIEENITSDNVLVMSVDDVNLRKGDKSSGCTVFLDGETHKVLIILSGTTKEITKQALEKFPSSDFFSRDRASAYSSAGSECEKTQVADRFHLIKNAHEAVKEALMATIPATIFIREGDGWVQAAPDAVSGKRSYFYVPDELLEERIRLAKLTPAKEKRYRNTVKMLELADKGLKTADIAKEMDILYKDVQALRRSAATTLQYVQDKIKKNVESQNRKYENRNEKKCDNPPKTAGGAKARPAKESIVEPFKETVIALVKSGGNHRSIYPEIKKQGYSGSQNAIYQYILKLRKESPDELKPEIVGMPHGLTLESCRMGTVYSGVLKEAKAKRNSKEENRDGKEPVSHQAKANKRPAEAVGSPFSDEIVDLIYGPDTGTQAGEAKLKKKPVISGSG